jgi:hypothetical protein
VDRLGRSLLIFLLSIPLFALVVEAEEDDGQMEVIPASEEAVVLYQYQRILILLLAGRFIIRLAEVALVLRLQIHRAEMVKILG